MGNWKIVRAVQVALVIVSLASGGAARAEVAVGASFGYTHITYLDVRDFSNDIVGIPGSDEWGQPGMRIGYLAPGGMWDLNADVGFVHRSGPHFDSESTLQLMPQLQVNIPVRSSFRPFVNAGVGLSRISTAFWADEVITGTRPVYGAGIGVRKSVSDHHGLVRAEFRYDYLPKWEKRLDAYDTVSYAASNQLSVKLGFDLLLSR